MPKKDPGTLFMDFQISPEDRVGGTPGKARKSKPAATPKSSRKPAAKSGRERTVPFIFWGYSMDFPDTAGILEPIFHSRGATATAR